MSRKCSINRLRLFHGVLSETLAMLERRVPQAVINRDDLFTAIWAKRFLAADLAAVRIVSRSARSTIGRALAIMISKLGNGWIYLILGGDHVPMRGSRGAPNHRSRRPERGIAALPVPPH